MSPKVSIVIPVYNVEEYLHECLDSVVNQTLKEIEIICIDDGSKDSSGAILDEYAARDSRFKVIHKENGGYGIGMNTGIDAATGEYIGIVEPDDYIELTMYETLYRKAKEFDLDLIKSDFRRFWHEDNGQIKFKHEVLDKTGKLYGVIVDLTENIAPYRFPMNTWTGIYKRSYLEKYHIRHHETPGASFQDNGFWMQTFWHAKRAMFLPDMFYNNRRDNPNSSVSNPAKVFCIKTEYDWIKGMIDADSELKRKFTGIFYLKKFHNYLFTFRRVDIKFKKLFLRTFHKEFTEALEKDELDLSLFGEGEKKDLELIVSRPMKFYCEKLNIPSFLDRVFSVKNDGDTKVLRFLGLKIKFRTSNLVSQTLKAQLDKQTREFNAKLNNIVSVYKEKLKERTLVSSARVDLSWDNKDKIVKVVNCNSNNEVLINYPAWLQHDASCGLMIESPDFVFDLDVDCAEECELTINLRAPDIRDKSEKSKRIPVWVTYTSMIINDIQILSNPVNVWHDKPYRHVMKCGHGQHFHFSITWKYIEPYNK